MVWRLSGECVQSNGIIFPMNDVKVSVCIVVYNSEKLIGRALESVLNQNLDSLEIVVVDDGSTDGSSGVIRYYAEKHSNIIAVYEENLGVSLARKNAVIHSHGDYIGFVDADDFVEPDMFRVSPALRSWSAGLKETERFITHTRMVYLQEKKFLKGISLNMI